jgi:dipeptidyl-peptidase 4
LILLSSVFIQAQDTPLTLENIYSKGAFSQKGFGPVRWMKDSRGYSTVEANEINQYDAQTVQRRCWCRLNN